MVELDSLGYFLINFCHFIQINKILACDLILDKLILAGTWNLEPGTWNLGSYWRYRISCPMNIGDIESLIKFYSMSFRQDKCIRQCTTFWQWFVTKRKPSSMFIFISSFMGNFLHLAFYMVIISVLTFSVEFIICRSKLQSISFGVAIRAQKVGSLLRVSLEFPLIQSKISQKAIGYCRVSMLMWVINFLKQS